MAMATGVPHEDSPELTPLAQDVPNPLALAAAGSDLAKVEVEREDALQGDGQAGDQMEVKDEDEEMDEMDSDGEGDAEDYERERARIIKENASLMAQLGLSNGAAIPHAHTNPNGSAHLSKSGKAGGSSEKKPALSTEERRIQRQARAQAAALKRQIQPSRRSGRVAAMASKADYTGDGSESPAPPSPPTYSLSKPSLPKVAAPFIPSGPEYDLTADDAGEYETRAPPPTRASDGTLVFEGRWKGVFTPNVTPEEMFRGGAFGGAFFCDTYSQSLRAPLPSAPDIASLPFPFPAHLIPTHLTAPEPDGSVNRFKQRAGQSLQAWEKAGWIWGVDPRGWAQWYCRFWAGRRGVDDERQIRRWIKVAGPTGRFKRSLLSTIQSRGGRAVLANEDVGRVVRQTLWQWAYELTESEYDRAMEGA